MLKIKGISDFLRNIGTVKQRTKRNNRSSLYKSLLVIEAESARRTPVDTGFLRASGLGNAIVYEATERGSKGVMFYTADYAVPVHEITKNKHVVGEAKFLENAIKAKTSQIKNMLGNDFKAVVGRSV